MTLTAENWPIAASLLPFGASQPRSSDEEDATWRETFVEVVDAGFEHVDLTDSWLPFGELSAERIARLGQALDDAGLEAASLSAIRRSVIDEEHGKEHLAYLHGCLDTAAALGIGVVSVGLHRALTEEQRAQLWFWTVEGHRDSNSPEVWQLAVERFRDLGRHAADLGILLSLELYEHTLLGTSASAVRLVEEIDLDVVGLNPDIGNLIRLHEPIERWQDMVQATLPYANFWHVKNYTRDENRRTGLVTSAPSYLESGLIDYRTAFKVALDAGFQGVICAEHYGGDGLSMSAANRDYLRSRILPRRPRPIGTSRVRQQFTEGKAL